MSARKLTVAALVSLCALMGVLAFGSVGAQGAVTHAYLSSPITEIPVKGPPPAEETVPFPGRLEGVSNMTVDSGELYVIDSEERLDKFNASTDAFIAQFPRPAAPLYDFHQGVAVGHGTGETEVYVAGDGTSGEEIQGRIAVYDGSGHFQGTWDGSDTPAGHFGCFECGGYGGVAADNSGNPLSKGLVYVVDPRNDVVDVFEPKAGGGEKYLRQITGPEPGVPFTELGGGRSASVAVDQLNGDVLVMEGTTTVDVLEPTVLGEYALVRRLTGTPAGAFEQVSDVTADGASGDIYVSEAERGVVDQFSSTGVYLGHLTGTANTPAGAFGQLSAVAVDPATGDVYVGDIQSNLKGEGVTSVHIFGPSVVVPDVTTEPASGVKPRSATLNGTVNPDEAGAATCRFEWGTSTSFGHVAPCEPEAVPDGNSPVAVHAALSGLQTDTTYYYRLGASNAKGTNVGETFQNQEFETSGPAVHQEAASVVTSASATLGAAIDPNNASTSYYFQYGTSAAYGSSVPAQPGLDLGSGKGDVAVSVHLQGLAAATVYHYRVVALSEVEGEPVTVEGPDQTFATQAAGTEVTQPDGRRWEMVSPPDKHGAGIIAVGYEFGDTIQAAADGSGIAYGANSSFVTNPAGSRSPEVVPVLSTRDAPGSWSSADLSVVHNEGGTVPLANGDEDRIFSSDLSLGAVEPHGSTPLPPVPSNQEAPVYLRAANGEYKAIDTSANLPSPPDTNGHFVTFVSGSPDLKHLVLQSGVALIPGAPASGLYEWTGGRLQLVSVLPNRENFSSEADLGMEGSAHSGNIRHAISNDGSRVVWEDHKENRYYLRDTVKSETVPIDAAQGVSEPVGARTTIYRTANSEGSRVFFTTNARLTASSTASENPNGGEDLYVFEVTSGKDEPLAGKPIDLAVDGNREETADVLGVIGASEDGSYVYFVANGVLGDGAEHGARHGTCERSVESPFQQSCNLYVEHYDEGTKTWAQPKWIAALSGEDAPTWGTHDPTDLKRMTSRVSPDGRYLAFMSERSLTGYENRDANVGVADEEVFLYDASAGRLVCASCDPTGARPVGMQGSALFEERLWDYAETWKGRWVAGDIPGWTTKDSGSSVYQSRYLADSGRLFFNSSDALVPADVNGTEDVYEYEPAGVGSCQGATHGQSASVVYDESVGGCVALISAGTSSEESAFMDASETGGDVFFLTLSKLAPQDYDTSIDMYDAHECTASAPCAPPPPLTPPPCTTGDACKAGPTPQPTLFGEPSSETFSGAGNIVPSTSAPKVASRSSGNAQKLAKALKACRKKPKRKRAGCARQAKKRYGAKQSRAGKSLSARTRR